MSKKPVIIFEGIEASGKTSNLKNVSRYLKKKNKDFVSFREPGGSKFSEILRKLILNNKSKTSLKTDFLLMLASRSENIDKIIKNNYRKKIILIDRFTDSTIAYQHYGMGISLKLIKSINDFIIDKYKPDLTILSTVNKKNFKERLKARTNINKYDKFNFSFYDKVQKGYLKILKKKKKCIIIDSNKNTIKESSDIIIKTINNFL